MDLRLTARFDIALSTDELRLICKALRGSMTVEEGEPAIKLCLKIQEARIKIVRQMADQMGRLEEDIKAAGN